MNGKYIGECDNPKYSTNLHEFGIHKKMDYPLLENKNQIIFKLKSGKDIKKWWKKINKLPRKLKKKKYGTLNAKKKLLKILKTRSNIPVKQFKRAGYELIINNHEIQTL